MQDMSKKDSRIYLVWFILVLLVGCSDKNKIRRLNFTKQPKIQASINDTLQKWISDSLAKTKPLFFDNEAFRVNNFIVFNQDSSLLYTTLNRKGIHRNSSADLIEEIGGSKIKDQWYFFFKGPIYVSRTLYKNSKYDPYSFFELEYISYEDIYPKVVRWLPGGNYEVKEEYFQKRYLGAIQNKCHEGQELRMCFDSIIIDLNQRYYDHKIDPKEIEDIKQSIEASVRPIEPKIELTTWEKIFGKEEKLFETQEWKDYINQKSKSNE